MSLPTQTQVLIVGAGPCGLACAITLAGLGLQVTIVDRLSEPLEGCRASAVHARTLEVCIAPLPSSK
jgi:2-polyprenyl-6-methoxyphenol hydroxylase-like FAD-dependent oxidoreductase